jgi:hypothetical protein
MAVRGYSALGKLALLLRIHSVEMKLGEIVPFLKCVFDFSCLLYAD